MRLGVFGGTFNPIHYGHLRAAEEAGEVAGLDRVLFVPSGDPPLKSADVAGVEHRLAMARLATASNPRFEALDIEAKRPGKSYTVNTLEELVSVYRDAELYFMLGIDAFLDLPRWREPERLIAMSNYIIINRPPHAFAELHDSPYLDADEDALIRLDRGLTAASISVGLKSGRSAVLVKTTALDISSSAVRGLVRAGRSLRYLLPEIVESYIMSHGLFI